MKKLILLVFLTIAVINLAIINDTAAAPESQPDQTSEPCNPKTFNSICSGDKLLICAKEVVKVIDCSENGNKEKTCAEFKDSKIARCISKEEKCIKEGEIIIKQKETGSEKKTYKRYKCEKTTHGDLYYHEMKNAKESTPKSTKNGAVDNTNSDSIEDRLKCSKENDVSIRETTLESGESGTDYYRCERNTDGNLMFRKLTKAEAEDYVNHHTQTANKHHINESNSISADKKIDDLDKKHKILDEDIKCDRSTFTNFCKNNYLFKCEDNRIKKENCKDNEKYNKCMQTADLKDAQCVYKKDICSNENDIVSRVEKNKNVKLNKEFKCQKASNGKLYLFYWDPRPKDSRIDLPF